MDRQAHREMFEFYAKQLDGLEAKDLTAKGIFP
jgi:hypothetical protein